VKRYEAINHFKMNTINSQDIAPDESVSQIDDVDFTWIATATAPSMHDISVSGVNTIASSNPTSVSAIGLPSEERYLLMNKDEVTVARARAILAVYPFKELFIISEIDQLDCSQGR
jgi:hypothetical protein